MKTLIQSTCLIIIMCCWLTEVIVSQNYIPTEDNRLHSSLKVDSVMSSNLVRSTAISDARVPNYISNIWPDLPMPAQLRAVCLPTPALSTGAAVFSVPLYSLQVKDLCLPFSLEYRSNGIRIGEDPFPIGYGWTFLPALRITRKVNGRPDGYNERTIPPGIESVDANLGHAVMHRSMASHGKTNKPILDPEYDLFTVFLADKTFNAYYNDGKLIAPGHTEYKIIVKNSFEGFVVTSPDGLIWNFNTQGANDGQGNKCEWCLTDIILPSGEKIDFKWQKGRHSIRLENNPLLEEFFYATPNGGGGALHMGLGGISDCPQLSDEDCMNIANIIFPGGTINFIYGQLGAYSSCVLKTMKINYEGKEIQSFSFVHEAVSHDAPLLKTVVLPDGSEYGFEYNSGRFTKLEDQDYWGFYNGKNNSHLMGPSMTIKNLGLFSESISFVGSDRRVDPEKMKSMILEKAVTPTGGIIEWDYEIHEFRPINFQDEKITGTLDSQLSKGGGLRVREIRMLEKAGDQNPRTVKYSYGSNGNGLANVEGIPSASTYLQNLNLVSPRFILEDIHKPDPLICEYGLLIVSPYSNFLTKMFGEDMIWYDEVSEIHEEGKTVHHFSKLSSNEIYHSQLGVIVPVSLNTWFSQNLIESKTEIFKQTGATYSLVEQSKFEYYQEEGDYLTGVHINRNKTQNTISSVSPDFDEGYTLYFPWETIPETYLYPSPSLGTYYRYWDGSIYTPYPYVISTNVTRLKSKSTTLYTSNSPYTVTKEYAFQVGSQILLSETERSCAQIVKTTYDYPTANDYMGALMISANVVGMPIGGAITCNQTTVKWKTGISAFSNNRYFRINSLDFQRGANPVYRVAAYTYSTEGDLKTIRNSGESEVSYTWDAYGRYPLSMSIANTLTYKAEWKPLVGVSSLTDASGVKTTYEYDNGNRLVGIFTNGKIKEDFTYMINYGGENSIISRKYKSQSDYVSTISRYDGLGRLYAVYTQTPSGWIGRLIDYDKMGRLRRSWIPVFTTSTTLSPTSFMQQAISVAEDKNPYRETQYESSPRGIKVSETMEGEVWHERNKKKITSFFTNDSKDHTCNRYSLTEVGITKNGLWPEGSLIITLFTDEDGIAVETFKDLRNHTICEKRAGVATYYIYDDYGDLRYVLPPGVETGGKRTDSKMQEIAYWYDYDDRGRCVLKKLPGAKPHLMRYDSDNRLVAERTINHADNIWRVYVYDKCGRVVLSIDCELTESEVAAYISVPRIASMTGSSTLCGYTISGTLSPKILDGNIVTAYYFDSYEFIVSQTLGGHFAFKHPFNRLGLSDRISNKNLVSVSSSKATGKLTGLYTGRGLEVYYYDNEGREIQRCATGYNQGYRTTVYNYDGSVASVHHNYNIIGNSSSQPTHNSGLRDRDTYHTYDQVGRLIKTSVVERYVDSSPNLNKADSAILVYNYDATGKINRIKRGLASSIFDYDIHGWRKSITTTLKRTTIVESIKYETGVTPRYNGFISQQAWNNYSFSYTYDHHGFLLKSNHTESDSPLGYTTEMTYDARGNITSINRCGVKDLLPSGTKILGRFDSMVVTFNGNKIKNIGTTIEGEVFDRRSGFYKDGMFEIQYDESGRVISDPTRGIVNISYDSNGQPFLLEVDDGACLITHSRDGLGQRLSSTITETGVSNRTIETSEYTGDGHFVRNGILEMSRFPGGYFDANLIPHYYITDNQGNNIGVYDGEGNLEQQVNYYPYGEPWLEPQYIEQHDQNRYLFGDKERLFFRRVNEYDFHARSYVANQGRFTSIDPMAEKTPWLSPYAYCASNPENYIDPDGKDIVVLNYTEGEHMAMLIQDSNGKWQYYSINGNNVVNPITKNHTGGRPFNDVAVGSWNSPEQFLNSSYNANKGEAGKADNSVNNYDFAEGFQITTSKEQDALMRNGFSKIAKTQYNLFTNNCTTAVQQVMIDAGLPVSKPTMEPTTVPMSTPMGLVDVFNGYKMKCSINILNILPSCAFKSIMKWNPTGRYIHK